MATRTHQLLPEGAQYLSGTAVPKLSKLNGTAFPVSSLLFRKDADESAYFKLPIIGYTSGDITFQVIWFSNGAATTGNVIWGAAVSAVSPNLDDVGVLSKSFATEATVSTAHLGGQAQRLHASTVTITSLDNMRASDQVWLRLTRKDDTYIDDVHVTQIVLSYPASSAGLESGGYYDIHTYATYELCRNTTGTTITKATPVYISGRQGDKILVAPADASDPAKMPSIGLAADTIDTGVDGYVHVIGACKGVNTNAYSLNQTLYVAPGGGLTPTKPANPNLIQNIGKVISIGNNGEILILGPGRTNDVPALAQSHVFIGNASGVTEQRQMTFADISGGGGNVTFAGVTVAETTANETPLSVSGYSLTGSGDVPALNVAGTWNTSAAPALLRANVTDTLSNAGALLLELRKNNVAQFTVGKEGQVASNAVTISGYSLTGTSATPALDISGTWNTSGTPTAIKLNITDTASNANSLLMDLRVGGASKFNINKDGLISIQGNVGIVSASNIRFWSTGSASFIIRNSINTQNRLSLDSNGGVLTLTNNSNQASSLLSDAVDALAQRNGTNPQIFRIYNTFTDASNYERGKIEWSSNVLRIGTEKAGTGTARALEFQTDGVTRYTLASGGGTSLTYVAPAAGKHQLAFVPDLVNFPSAAGIGFSIENGGSAMRVHNIVNNESSMAFRNGSVDFAATGRIAWTNTNFNPTATIDIQLVRDGGSGILAQRNSNTSQTFRVYNTFTDGNTYERGKLEWASNVFRIGTEKGSTGGTARALEIQTDAVTRLTVGASGSVTLADANDIAVGNTTGTKIGTATGQKLGFWNAAPVVQPTTAVAEGSFVENGGGTAVNEDSTFDGYTLQQVVRALRDIGLLA